MALRGSSHVTFDEFRLVYLDQAIIFDLFTTGIIILVIGQILFHVLIDVCQERLIRFIFHISFLFVLKRLVRPAMIVKVVKYGIVVHDLRL